jgi:hypothetical protein
VNAPHGKARCAGRQTFNRLIEPAHRKAFGYPAWTLSCCHRASNQMSNDHHRQQRTLADVDGQYFLGRTCRSLSSPRRELVPGRRGHRFGSRSSSRREASCPLV